MKEGPTQSGMCYEGNHTETSFRYFLFSLCVVVWFFHGNFSSMGIVISCLFLHLAKLNYPICVLIRGIHSENQDSSSTKDDIPATLRIRTAVATALGAAAAHAKLLADQEEREIEHLVANIIGTEVI